MTLRASRALASVEPLLSRSAISLAASIRQGDVSSEEVVAAHIERAKRTHARIHAVVADRYEAALAEAGACDRRVRSGGPLPPLLGVPCSIKECFALTGMPQSAGLVARRDFRATSDAMSVRVAIR